MSFFLAFIVFGALLGASAWLADAFGRRFFPEKDPADPTLSPYRRILASANQAHGERTMRFYRRMLTIWMSVAVTGLIIAAAITLVRR